MVSHRRYLNSCRVCELIIVSSIQWPYPNGYSIESKPYPRRSEEFRRSNIAQRACAGLMKKPEKTSTKIDSGENNSFIQLVMTDMPQEMVNLLVKTLTGCLNGNKIESSIPMVLTETFQRNYGHRWHCGIGENLVANIGFVKGTFIQLKLGLWDIVLFRA
ncbi:hypothetical protein GJ496_008956 [Pomphorhynchus laevis]|nr:hypothetical protein GJ496_008956 [Pomphorhynchus laevis]